MIYEQYEQCPQWLEKSNEDPRAAAKFICALKYNKLKIFSQTKYVST